MVRLVKRVPVPRWLRHSVSSWFDRRYVTRAQHKNDIRDSLWEVKVVARELAELRREVERLGARVAAITPDGARMARWDDAHRLAGETAAAVDRILQNEVLLWQAVDRVEAAVTSLAAAENTTAAGTDGKNGGERGAAVRSGAGAGNGTGAKGMVGAEKAGNGRGGAR
jgi:hypothetical protein